MMLLLLELEKVKAAAKLGSAKGVGPVLPNVLYPFYPTVLTHTLTRTTTCQVNMRDLDTG